MKAFGDLNWRLAPLVSFLYALGGWGFLPIRRFGVPLAILFFVWLSEKNFKKTWKLYLFTFVLILFVLSLPLTLFGDAVRGNWINWAWLWVLGAIQVNPLFLLAAIKNDVNKGFSSFCRWGWAILIHTAIVGSVTTLSNATGYPVHAWVEILIGLSYGGITAWIIGEES